MILVYRRFLALLFISLFLLPLATAQEEPNTWEVTNSLAWEHNFESGFISTSPIFTGELILVRTSGNGEPAVTAFGVNGEMVWHHFNNASTNNDMSPLLHVSAGEGPCGTWQEMVLVGWSDGQIQALSPSNGDLIWSIQSEVRGWGVTGELALDGEFVLVPTRQGLGKYCLADGQEQWWTQTNLAWRNGVAVTETGYFLGDEYGKLWHVDRAGSATGYALQLGKIRHAPLVTDAGLVIHAQAAQGSTVAVVNAANGLVIQQFSAGPSPAIPTSQGQFVVTGDSSAIRIFQCTTTCEPLDQVPFHTNGEMNWFDNGMLLLPSNIPESKWGLFSFDGLDNLSYTELDIGLYGYGTSSAMQYVHNGTTYTAFGNDQSLLRVFSGYKAEETSLVDEFDWGVQGLVFILFILIGSSTVLFLNGKFDWFLRTSSLFILIIFVLLLPDFSSQWSKTVDEQFPQEATPEQWNELWPDTWMGTQIVIIELNGEEYVVGGILGHSDVYSLTMDACNELGFEVASEPTELGYYIKSIHGVEANGWEFFVDGSKGIVSADNSDIQATSIVRWTPV